MARKAHHKVEPQCTIELRVLIDNPHPFIGYKTHPCPHMTQELFVEVPIKRTLLDKILKRPAKTKMTILSRPTTRIAIGHATIYCHPDHIPAIRSAQHTSTLCYMSEAPARKAIQAMEALCQ